MSGGTKMTHENLDLAVLEGRYWSKENDSIKPAFDLLANVYRGTQIITATKCSTKANLCKKFFFELPK